MADTHNGKKARRQIPAETKLQILKEGRSTNLSISQVCEQYAISPTLLYQWEQIANRAALAALQGQPRGRKKVRPGEEALLAEVQASILKPWRMYELSKRLNPVQSGKRIGLKKLDQERMSQ